MPFRRRVRTGLYPLLTMKTINASQLIRLFYLLAVSLLLQLLVPVAEADQFPDWVFDEKLTASDAEDGDWFGQKVAVSGDIAVVGARSENGDGSQRGAAYVFNYMTGVELFKLTASDTADSDEFGRSVAVTGNRAVIGADEKNGGEGSAYLFDITTGMEERILVPSVVAANSFFGVSCDIEGNFVIVGASDENAGGTDRGAVYVFDATTGNQLFRLTAPDAADFDYFGFAVAVSGNYAIVGASYANGGENRSGKVYVFDLADSGSFKHQVVPSVIDEFAMFGTSVAAQGDFLVVGAPDEGAGGAQHGAAYLFQLSTGTLLKRVVSTTPKNNGKFGTDVAISDDLMLVGARDEDSGAVNAAGAAYVFGLPNGNLLQRIVAPDGQSLESFGAGVAVTNEHALVGAEEEYIPNVERGALYVFEGTTLPSAVSTCNTVLKAALLNKAKKLKKKAKAAQKKGQVAKAKKLKKKAKKLLKRAKALC